MEEETGGQRETGLKRALKTLGVRAVQHAIKLAIIPVELTWGEYRFRSVLAKSLDGTDELREAIVVSDCVVFRMPWPSHGFAYDRFMERRLAHRKDALIGKWREEVGRLVELMSDPERALKLDHYETTEAIARVGTPLVEPLASMAAQHGSPVVLFRAQSVIREIGEPALPILTKMLRDPKHVAHRRALLELIRTVREKTGETDKGKAKTPPFPEICIDDLGLKKSLVRQGRPAAAVPQARKAALLGA